MRTADPHRSSEPRCRLGRYPAHIAMLAFWLSTACGSGESFDLVILHGRIIDPDAGLDAVRHVAVRDGLVAAISPDPPAGVDTIDARGRIVAPGFIDLHSHGQDPENDAAKVLDGVTSAFELEVGTADVDAWYAGRAGTARLNHGVSIGHAPVRMRILHDTGDFLPRDSAAHRVATASEIAAMTDAIIQGLDRGAVAVGFGLQYTPAASSWEVLEMFKAAARAGASCQVHMRFMGNQEPNTSVRALEEIIAAAAITGAPLHVVHISSSGLRAAGQLLEMIGQAQARGLDVTTECYPYTAGMTRLE